MGLIRAASVGMLHAYERQADKLGSSQTLWWRADPIFFVETQRPEGSVLGSVSLTKGGWSRYCRGHGTSGAPKSRQAPRSQPEAKTLERCRGSGCTGVEIILGKPRGPMMTSRRGADVGECEIAWFGRVQRNFRSRTAVAFEQFGRCPYAQRRIAQHLMKLLD